ncbi:MAG: nucleoside triphosphate pyrophosphohydrolase [Rhodomicrobiaceae bacterium]
MNNTDSNHSFIKETYELEDLLAIMAQLRNPDGGCPWDLKQDFKSISSYTIEEAYEVVDAIDRGDKDDLCDELGDLLFQVVYYAQMASEEESFEFQHVIQAICEKLVRRHPHVFGDDDLKSDLEIKGMWERIKLQEKSLKGGKISGAPSSILDDVPVGLPALSRAVKLQNKAAKVGFDWPDASFVFDKIEEELNEVKEAFDEAQKDKTDAGLSTKSQEKLTEEIGDLLFVITNLARHLNIDPEHAARSANNKFCSRFFYIEKELQARGVSFDDASLEEMDALWDEAKLHE